jgi:hypothetical protein
MPAKLAIEWRFWSKVTLAPSGCWEWQAARNEAGYGVIGYGPGKTTLAHRVSYMLCIGPVPCGMFVCHSCDNPGCVHPAHLWIGDQTANMRDMARKGRSPRYRSYLTHCKYGHPFSPENVYSRKSGWRRCRECAKENNRAYDAAHRKERARVARDRARRKRAAARAATFTQSRLV